MISFVILHYLVVDETVKCVNSILKLQGGEFSVIIVDNASPNDSFHRLQNSFEDDDRVYVIKNIGNTGYAGGINFGFAFAKNELKSQFIVAMNNDMEIKQVDFCLKIRSIFKRTAFAVLGPDIVSTSAKKHQNPEPFSMLTLSDVDREIQNIEKKRTKRVNLFLKSKIRSNKTMLKSYYYLKSFFKKNHSASIEKQNVTLHGAFYVFSPLYINRRNYALYPKTKFYCEAQILDYECKRDGLEQLYSPSVVVFHHEDVATDAVSGSYYKKMMKKYDQLLESLNVFKQLIKDDQKKGMSGKVYSESTGNN